MSERAEQKKDHYDGQAVRDAWISGRLDRMKANLAPSWDDFLGVVEILKYEREFLGALSPVRAQEPTLLRYTPEQIEQQRQHCAEMQAFLRHTGTRANAPLKTATMCAEIAAVLDLYMEAIEAMALPPVQATTAEAEPRYCQKCGSNAIRTVEPGLFVCDWCDAVMRDKSSPLRETPAPDLARVRALVETWKKAASDWRGQAQASDSPDRRERCLRRAYTLDECVFDLSAALEGAATKHVNTKE